MVNATATTYYKLGHKLLHYTNYVSYKCLQVWDDFSWCWRQNGQFRLYITRPPSSGGPRRDKLPSTPYFTPVAPSSWSRFTFHQRPTDPLPRYTTPFLPHPSTLSVSLLKGTLWLYAAPASYELYSPPMFLRYRIPVEGVRTGMENLNGMSRVLAIRLDGTCISDIFEAVGFGRE